MWLRQAPGEGKQDLTYSFEGDVKIVENCLVPAPFFISEPQISLLLQQAQHLLGSINSDRLSQGKFSASCKSLQVVALKQAGHPRTVRSSSFD